MDEQRDDQSKDIIGDIAFACICTGLLVAFVVFVWYAAAVLLK